MKELVEQFAHDYDLDLERHMYRGDEQRRINNPVVFLFLGDKSLEALQAIGELNRRKWNNSAGVVYLHLYTGETVERDNLFSFRLPEPPAERQTMRQSMAKLFYQEEQKLYELNRTIRQACSRIAEFGGMFATNQRLNLSVVTQVDDVANVLLPELSLLVQTVCRESFKHVQLDLYALLREKNSGGEFGYSTALGVSFLKELDRYQRDDYHFRANLQVTEDRIKLPVEHAPGPLFTLAYLLSDKDERGLFTRDSMADNYELICNLNLLKNRGQRPAAVEEARSYAGPGGYEDRSATDTGRDDSASWRHKGENARLGDRWLQKSESDRQSASLSYKSESDRQSDGLRYKGESDRQNASLSYNSESDRPAVDYDRYKSFQEQNETYNDVQFMRNITSRTGKPAFASAGLAKVTRPNATIAATVLACFTGEIMQRLKRYAPIDKREALELLALDAAALHRQVVSLLPEDDRLEEMTGLMSDKISFGELRQMTLRQAEEALYRDGSERFFQANFVEVAQRRLESSELQEQLAERLLHSVMESERFGLYHAYAWTNEHDSERGLIAELHKLGKDTARQLDTAKAELAELYQLRAEHLPMKKGGLFTSDKERVKQFVRSFFQHVYGKKYEILGLSIQQQLLLKYERVLTALHGQLNRKVTELAELEQMLNGIAAERIHASSDQFGQNMKEYYQTVVHEIVQDLEAKWGAAFYYEPRFLGNAREFIHSSTRELLQRLLEICRKEVLTYPQFQLTFEEELLQRANVSVRYEQRTILSKEELFKELARSLEENAAIHLEVFQYMQKHRYEEKYFFADFASDFVRYAFASERGTRTYKLGCIEEKRSSGIEKLRLMGGFHTDDLMYVHNGQKYYDSYIANGYQFHAASSQADVD